MKKIFVSIFALIIFLAPVFCSAEEVIIFHTNDMHSRILKTDDDGRSIGFAEITGAVKAVKKKNPATFWFDAGDTLHGMSRINLSYGENMVSLLNSAGIDIFVPGNHDFNYGADKLEKLSAQMKFPVLSANIVRKNNPAEKVFKSYKIFTTKSGIKIGVFGLTTPETAYKASPSKVAAVEFLNPVETAKEMISELRPQCDILVAVMHMGVDESSEFTSDRIARETQGIHIIIDGHSHTELPEGLQVGETLIAQTGCYEHNLGQVTVEVDDKKIISKQAKLLNAAEVEKLGEPDKKILKSVTKIEKHFQQYLGQVVAQSDKFLIGERAIARREECELGNLITDALRWKSTADVAIINGGGIRTSLPKGQITRGDIFAILPFQNKLMKAEIDGKTLREALEHGVKFYPDAVGGFPQVSGITFSFDCKKPEGQRTSEIFVDGKPLDENKIYTIAAPDFLFEGGDGYTMLKDLKILAEFDTAENVLMEYLKKVGIKNVEVGRIKNLNVVPLPEDEATKIDEVLRKNS